MSRRWRASSSPTTCFPSRSHRCCCASRQSAPSTSRGARTRDRGRHVLNANLFPYLLGLATFLFTVGAAGVLIRRNPIVGFMCIELMLTAANVALVAYGRFLNSQEGQIFAFMVIVVAAAEVVVGLADRKGHV